MQSALDAVGSSEESPVLLRPRGHTLAPSPISMRHCQSVALSLRLLATRPTCIYCCYNIATINILPPATHATHTIAGCLRTTPFMGPQSSTRRTTTWSG